MQRMIRRLALGAVSGMLLLAITAVPALAQPATTSAATNVTATTAVLNGVVTTGGSNTTWEFQYGKTTVYGEVAPVPAGSIAGTTPSAPVSIEVENLSPGTTYHFRLVVATSGPAPYYYLTPSFGNDLTFTTSTIGSARLVHKLLPVRNGKVTVTLRCVSKVACHARLNIIKHAFVRIKNKRTLAALRCTVKDFTIRAGKTKRELSKMNGACLALLRTAPHHRIIARLNVIFTSGQKAVKGRNVILQLL